VRKERLINSFKSIIYGSKWSGEYEINDSAIITIDGEQQVVDCNLLDRYACVAVKDPLGTVLKGSTPYWDPWCS
jgi:hypothetical protein